MHRHGAALGKVALDHALAMHLQNAAVGKPAGHGLLEFRRAGAAFFSQQHRFGHGTNRDAYDQLIGQLAHLPRTVRAHMRGTPQDL